MVFSLTGFYYIGFMSDVFRSSNGRRQLGRAADKKGAYKAVSASGARLARGSCGQPHTRVAKL